jgi:putative colanic acid biosynthesis acetyltransferase WcaF
MKYQGLSKFVLPSGACYTWINRAGRVIQSTLFALLPQFIHTMCNFLLRLFGAEIGKGVIIHPTV